MSFTGHEDHFIDLQTASEWTANYREAFPDDIKGHFFGKDDIQRILDQNECVGMRLYYAIDANGAKQIIVTGVKANEDDLFGGLLAERSYPCPPMCGSSNPLN